jgi:Xaa-Pro aminopeptidase
LRKKGKIMKNRINALRKLVKDHGVEAYLVPSSDPHQSEYVPEFWQRRKFISGFTGSAGDGVITRNKAGLWIDSRYFLQAEQELDKKVFTLFRMGMRDVPSIEDWLIKELKKGESLGIDPQVISRTSFVNLQKKLEEKGIGLKCIEINLVDAVWEDRPEAPKGNIEIHAEKYSGESTTCKLKRVREKMAEADTDALVVTMLDSIAWLFNIRGSDVKYNPVNIAYGLVTAERAMLFMDKDKIPAGARRALKEIEILDYQDFGSRLQNLAQKKASVWLDEASVSQWTVNILEKGARLFFKPSPIKMFKAIKNKTEINGFRNAHIRDGAAMVKFLCWLEKSVKKSNVTEVSAAEKAAAFRAKNDLFKGMSFETISSYGAHGAVVHYTANSQTDVPLKPKGIYLIDSGGQYLDGTTDITRTVTLGNPTEEQKDRFTRVLKGLIDLLTTSFPQGTVGKQLDTIARMPLWKKGLNYGHGTGHGIGTFLNVHEGPQAISYYRCIGIALEPGMITTIEPGYYKENEYGLRVENIALVVKDDKRSSHETPFFTFENLTLCPIDIRLVKKELLTQKEINWLNDYHKKVYKTLAPLLDKTEATWLKQATQEI